MTRRKDPGRPTFEVDLHTHTRFFHWNPGSVTRFDGIGAGALEAFARWRDLDGVAFTNHDYHRPLGGDDGVATLPGIEVTTTQGHVLVVGPDPPRDTTPGEPTPAEVVDRAHEGDCAAILAHPFRNSTVAESGADLDAVEVNGKHPGRRAAVERLAADLGLPLVAGSDAHYPFEVGRAYTAVDAGELTPGAVAEAIRAGRVEARVVESLPYRLLRAGYGRIHASKGHD